MNARRRIAVLVTAAVAVAGLSALPAARATEPTAGAVSVPARDIGCVWLDAIDISVCLSG